MQKINLTKKDLEVIRFLAGHFYNEYKSVKKAGDALEELVDHCFALHAKISRYEGKKLPDKIYSLPKE